jgi:hypothetical protein
MIFSEKTSSIIAFRLRSVIRITLSKGAKDYKTVTSIWYYSKCHLAEGHHAECHYVKSRGGEIKHAAIFSHICKLKSAAAFPFNCARQWAF